MQEHSSSLMTKNQMRQTYLVTYSQADKSKFPIRELFGEEIVKAFVMGFSKATTGYQAFAVEAHQEEGEHYHASIKLSGVKKIV